MSTHLTIQFSSLRPNPHLLTQIFIADRNVYPNIANFHSEPEFSSFMSIPGIRIQRTHLTWKILISILFCECGTLLLVAIRRKHKKRWGDAAWGCKLLEFPGTPAVVVALHLTLAINFTTTVTRASRCYCCPIQLPKGERLLNNKNEGILLCGSHAVELENIHRNENITVNRTNKKTFAVVHKVERAETCIPGTVTRLDESMRGSTNGLTPQIQRTDWQPELGPDKCCLYYLNCLQEALARLHPIGIIFFLKCVFIPGAFQFRGSLTLRGANDNSLG